MCINGFHMKWKFVLVLIPSSKLSARFTLFAFVVLAVLADQEDALYVQHCGV